MCPGIVLLGSYLPDLFGDHSNSFPVPVLTAVGELDGLTLSYVYRLLAVSRHSRLERVVELQKVNSLRLFLRLLH